MSEKKQTQIRLSDKERAFLDEVGGVSKGVSLLIEEKRRKMDGEEREMSIEEKFMEPVIFPAEPHMKEVYKAFLIAFLKNGGRMGSLDFYASQLTGATGYDEKTIRKIFRKLSSSGFVKSEYMVFRPTIRFKTKKAAEGFQEIFEDYIQFIQQSEPYDDFLE